jgi:L-rhodinosyltransferase/glycosyltransferase
MRILFAILPVTSHLLPLAPVAWALQSAGHEVRVATHTHPTMADTITGTGLTAVSLGEEIDLAAAVQATFDNDTLQQIAEALGIDPADSNLWQMVRNYAVCTFAMYYRADAAGGEKPTMVEELVAFARAWQPDLVIWDPLFFPAAIAARASGAVHARLLWGLDRFGWIRMTFRDWLGESQAGEPRVDLMASLMKPTLDRFGQEFDEELLVGQWTIDPTPSEMRLPVDLHYVPVRPVPYNGAAAVPQWLLEPLQRPRVCLTLGTSGRELFAGNEISVAEILQSVADMDVEVVATLNATQLAGVDRIPSNVRTIEYVPLNLLLPTCSAVIHLGGTGTLAAALAQGVPQILIPKDGSEYVDFSNHVASRGAGLVIEQKDLTVETVKKSLVRVLTEESFRKSAAALYEEMSATPSPIDLVPVLEKLTEKHRR